MRFKAIIFDMDGVLVDSEPLHVIIETAMIKEMEIPLKKEMYSKFAGTTSLSMWKTLIEEFHLDKNPNELSAESDRRFVDTLLNTEQVQLFEGVREVLINLYNKGIPIALASSSSRMIVDAILEKFNLRQYFSAVVTGSDIQNSKPHPEIFLLAAKKLKVSPSESVVIEDSPNGVKAAQLAGMNCIGFASEKNHHDISHATWIIKSFGEFDYELFNR
ncbi:MAG: HAD family phosphatase [Bacteroidales bacterium]|nr:MAG: HAD family phosphatase [Bacteroidales bacterium]